MFIWSKFAYIHAYIFSAVANRAFGGQRLLKIWYATPPPGSGVYIAWPLLPVHGSCLCIIYDLFTVQLIYVHDRWYVCMADSLCTCPLIHVRVIYQLLYVHDHCWLCMSDDVCAWPCCCLYMADIVPCMTYNICTRQRMYVQCTWPLLSVHYRWCLFDSCGLYMTAAACAWPLLSVHGCCCLYMTKAVLSVAWVLGKCSANLGTVIICW